MLNLAHMFYLFKNLKGQILEICPSAKESAHFYYTIDVFLRISLWGWQVQVQEARRALQESRALAPALKCLRASTYANAWWGGLVGRR